MTEIILTRITIRAGLVLYRDQVSILKKGYAQEKYRIENIARSFLGEKFIDEVTSVDIATYRDIRLKDINPKSGQTLSTATVRLEMSLMSNFFDIARIEWGLCNANPVLNVRKPKPAPGRDRRLSSREERLILRYCHSHKNRDLYSIVVIALETAMRQGEIINLTWEHINLKSRIAHLPETKNGTKRDIPLSIKARDALIRLGVQSKGPVFSYTANGLKSTWRFILLKLNIKDLHFHDLRHEATSRLFELGTLDIMEISAITGHKSLSMLKRYTHLRAIRLVRKLEGNKQKGKQAVLDHLIPYPVCIEEEENHVNVRILDFDGVIVSGENRDKAMQAAQNTLMRLILRHIKTSTPIPPPDQYLETVNETHVIMLDPLDAESLTT